MGDGPATLFLPPTPPTPPFSAAAWGSPSPTGKGGLPALQPAASAALGVSLPRAGRGQSPATPTLNLEQHELHLGHLLHPSIPQAREPTGPFSQAPKFGVVLFVCIVGRERGGIIGVLLCIPSPLSPSCRAGTALRHPPPPPFLLLFGILRLLLPGEGEKLEDGVLWGRCMGRLWGSNLTQMLASWFVLLFPSTTEILGEWWGQICFIFLFFPSWGEGIACSQAFLFKKKKIWVSSSPPPPLLSGANYAQLMWGWGSWKRRSTAVAADDPR